MPLEIATKTVESVEYVAVRCSKDEVALIAADWTHKTCPTDTELVFECKKADDYSRFYPVLRGHTVRVPAQQSLLDNKGLVSTTGRDRMLLPWSGITLVSTEPSRLSLVSVSLVGDLFRAKLKKDRSAPEDGEMPDVRWGECQRNKEKERVAKWSEKCDCQMIFQNVLSDLPELENVLSCADYRGVVGQEIASKSEKATACKYCFLWLHAVCSG